MWGRIGLGPVFWLEWTRTARRWQMFALRLGILLALLGLILCVPDWSNGERYWAPLRYWPKINSAIFGVLVHVLLFYSLIVAPVGPALSVCDEKNSGGLMHLLVTDLSDFEIVAGKFAAHFWTVFSLVLSVTPILILISFTGGVTPEIVLGAASVILGTAFFMCSLAMFLSTMGRKVHEVLMVTYLVPLLLVLGPYLLDPTKVWQLTSMSPFDPFHLVSGTRTAGPMILEQARFFGVAVLLGLGLLMGTWLLLRRVSVAQAGRGESPVTRHHMGTRVRLDTLLDRDPVLWKECLRREWKGWGRWIWVLFWLFVAILSTMALVLRLDPSFANAQQHESVVTMGWCILAGILLLLANVSAVTSMADERRSGTIDVILTTQLSPYEIVGGKLWGICWAMLIPVVALVLGWFLPWVGLSGADARRLGRQEFLLSHWLSFFLFTLMLANQIRLAVCLGLYLGARIQSPRQAWTVSVLVMLSAHVLYIFVLIALMPRRTDYTYYLACASGWFCLLLSQMLGSFSSFQSAEIIPLFLWGAIHFVIGSLLLRAIPRLLVKAKGPRPRRSVRTGVVRCEEAVSGA